MGNTPSTEETAQKLTRDGALTLPLGSKVEELFHEDFSSSQPPAPTTQQEVTRSASLLKVNPRPPTNRQQQRLSRLQEPFAPSQDKWAPVATGFSELKHANSKARGASPECTITKPLPTADPPIPGHGPGASLSPHDALSHSSNGKAAPAAPLSRSSSGKAPSSKHDSGTVAEVPSTMMADTATPAATSSGYSAADSRWQERISRRIADRKVSDGVKAGLSQTAYMGTGASTSTSAAATEAKEDDGGPTG